MSLLARLIEAGTPAALIEEVAMLLAEKKISDAAIADRRAKDRSRQERKRSRDEAYCHVTERDIGNGAFPAPPNENNLTPPTHTPETKPRARKEPEIPIPADWQPKQFSVGTICRGIVDGWPPGELAFQAEKFAAHHRKTQARWADWQAVWKTWVLNSRDFRSGTQGNGNAGNRQDDGMGRTERAAMQALRELGGDTRSAMRTVGGHALARQEPNPLLAIGHVGGGSD